MSWTEAYEGSGILMQGIAAKIRAHWAGLLFDDEGRDKMHLQIATAASKLCTRVKLR